MEINHGVPVQPKINIVYIIKILNGKGNLTGCGLRRDSIVSVLFQQVNPI